jgi:hypothetical protein
MSWSLFGLTFWFQTQIKFNTKNISDITSFEVCITQQRYLQQFILMYMMSPEDIFENENMVFNV